MRRESHARFYESPGVKFLGATHPYGFRPGRSQHDALDALSYALLKKKVNYILDADKGRSECLDPRTTGFQIERRDLRKRLRVLAARKKYQVIPLFDLATEQETADFLCSGRHWRNWTKQSGRETGDPRRELKITFTYQPSTEEQLMFGCVARRWIVRRRDEHDQKIGENWTEAITDAWYVDSRELSTRFAGFSSELIHQGFCYVICSDELAAVHHLGERPSGLCVSSQTKSLRHIQLPSGDVQEHTEMSSVRVLRLLR